MCVTTKNKAVSLVPYVAEPGNGRCQWECFSRCLHEAIVKWQRLWEGPGNSLLKYGENLWWGNARVWDCNQVSLGSDSKPRGYSISSPDSGNSYVGFCSKWVPVFFNGALLLQPRRVRSWWCCETFPCPGPCLRSAISFREVFWPIKDRADENSRTSTQGQHHIVCGIRISGKLGSSLVLLKRRWEFWNYDRH